MQFYGPDLGNDVKLMGNLTSPRRAFCVLEWGAHTGGNGGLCLTRMNPAQQGGKKTEHSLLVRNPSLCKHCSALQLLQAEKQERPAGPRRQLGRRRSRGWRHCNELSSRGCGALPVLAALIPAMISSRAPVPAPVDPLPHVEMCGLVSPAVSQLSCF